MARYSVIPIGDLQLVSISSSNPAVIVGTTSAGQIVTYSVFTGLVTWGAPLPPVAGLGAINDGQPPTLVGDMAVDASSVHAFRWVLGADTLTDLHPLLPFKDAWTIALGINDAGDIVGRADGNHTRGWLLPRKGSAVDLNASVDSSIMFARHINNAKHPQIVGYTQKEDVFFYDTAGAGEFSVLPSICKDPEDLNDHGVAVGLGSAAGLGWLYDRKTEAAQPISPLPGSGYSPAEAINNDGQFVGFSAGRGYIGSYQGTQIVDVHALDDDIPGAGADGWSIKYAWDINDAGEIVAYGSWQGGPEVAVLLEPLQGRSLPPGLAAYIAILFGVLNDAPGAGLIGRHLVRPDPDDPWVFLERTERDLLLGIGINGLAKQVSDPVARGELRRAYAEMVRRAGERLAAPTALPERPDLPPAAPAARDAPVRDAQPRPRHPATLPKRWRRE